MTTKIDRGDTITEEQREFLLYQNAMAELATAPDWWSLIRGGFQQSDSSSHTRYWVRFFHDQAALNDPWAVALITKVIELRVKR